MKQVQGVGLGETAGAEACGRCSEGTVLASGLQRGWELGLTQDRARVLAAGPGRWKVVVWPLSLVTAQTSVVPVTAAGQMAPLRVSQLHGDVKESLVRSGKLNFDL